MIFVNGERRELEGSSLALDRTLVDLGFTGKHFAVAINGDFVPRHGYESCLLQGGERLEILSPMQGG